MFQMKITCDGIVARTDNADGTETLTLLMDQTQADLAEASMRIAREHATQPMEDTDPMPTTPHAPRPAEETAALPTWWPDNPYRWDPMKYSQFLGYDRAMTEIYQAWRQHTANPVDAALEQLKRAFEALER